MKRIAYLEKGESKTWFVISSKGKSSSGSDGKLMRNTNQVKISPPNKSGEK
jgi:hypothetical protein